MTEPDARSEGELEQARRVVALAWRIGLPCANRTCKMDGSQTRPTGDSECASRLPGAIRGAGL